jgi:hypothetical protein
MQNGFIEAATARHTHLAAAGRFLKFLQWSDVGQRQVWFEKSTLG